MNIKLGDVLEVRLWRNFMNQNTFDQRDAFKEDSTRYVRVIGIKEDRNSLFGTLCTEYLLGWSEEDVNSMLIGSLEDFELTSSIPEFDNYICRWWMHSGVKVLGVVSNFSKQAVLSGATCKGCLEYYPMAEPNRPDGSMVCYSCRTYYGWKYCKE